MVHFHYSLRSFYLLLRNMQHSIYLVCIFCRSASSPAGQWGSCCGGKGTRWRPWPSRPQVRNFPGSSKIFQVNYLRLSWQVSWQMRQIKTGAFQDRACKIWEDYLAHNHLRHDDLSTSCRRLRKYSKIWPDLLISCQCQVIQTYLPKFQLYWNWNHIETSVQFCLKFSW